MNKMQEAIQTFYDAQFAAWPQVRDNYNALTRVEQRMFRFGDLPVSLLHNPARARSTDADVSNEAISERPCFLCSANRPKEQIADRWNDRWEILVNPYPIFPVHFTIAAADHVPQAEMPLEMVNFVDAMPGLAAFYNGARAGASAPDHLHFQATLPEEFPLLRLVEERQHEGLSNLRTSTDLLPEAPFRFFSLEVYPDLRGMQLLNAIPLLCGGGEGLFNAIVWKDGRGVLRLLIFPRKAHRPRLYYEPDEKRRRRISPGAVDMAGVLVVPHKADFDALTEQEIRSIYDDVSVSDEQLKKLADEALPG